MVYAVCLRRLTYYCIPMLWLSLYSFFSIAIADNDNPAKSNNVISEQVGTMFPLKDGNSESTIKSDMDQKNIDIVDIAGPFDGNCENINYLTASSEIILICGELQNSLLGDPLRKNIAIKKLYNTHNVSRSKIRAEKNFLYGYSVYDDVDVPQSKEFDIEGFYNESTRTNFISITTKPKPKKKQNNN